MDFIDSLIKLSDNIRSQCELIQSEEATKNAFVMPFIQILGYNVFDSREVVPEFRADVGTKKGEKVDYAIMRGAKPIILFECKKYGEDLKKCHTNQLFRYFSVTEAQIAILTNGTQYRVFSDLEKSNQMDSRPFLEFNLLDEIKESLAAKIEKLSKDHFDIREIIPFANHLMYVSKLVKYLDHQAHDPSNAFVKFCASQVYGGVKTQQVVKKFSLVTQEALIKFAENRVEKKIRSIVQKSNHFSSENEVLNLEKEADDNGIETTEEEIEGFHIVKSIVRKWVDADRITYKDNRTYFAVLLDGNNRKTICRLHFNSSQKYVSLTVPRGDYTRYPLERLDNLYDFEEHLKEVIMDLENLACVIKKYSKRIIAL